LFHELIVRIAGLHITSLIYFLMPQADYSANQMTLSMRLTEPATKDIIAIVRSGFVFKIRLYASVSVNQNRVLRFERVKSLSIKDSSWFMNDTLTDSTDARKRLGECKAVFGSPHLQEGDRLLFYLSATILPDQDFETSTGLTTAILWNYYIPHLKLNAVFENGAIVFEK
jgi:hypothetical protein